VPIRFDIEHQTPPIERGAQIDRAKRQARPLDPLDDKRDFGIGGEQARDVDGRAGPTGLSSARRVPCPPRPVRGQHKARARDGAADHRAVRARCQVQRQRQLGVIQRQAGVAQMGGARLGQRHLPRQGQPVAAIALRQIGHRRAKNRQKRAKIGGIDLQIAAEGRGKLCPPVEPGTAAAPVQRQIERAGRPIGQRAGGAQRGGQGQAGAIDLGRALHRGGAIGGQAETGVKIGDAQASDPSCCRYRQSCRR
jgi:hypothetical protein